MNIKTIEEARKLGLKIRSCSNEDWYYQDENETQHLMRDGEEIAKGQYVHSYNNGDYKYEDTDEIEHLIRNEKEIAKGKCVHSYDNGDYKYKDENGIWHIVEVDEKPEKKYQERIKTIKGKKKNEK